jgi:hypothetical protein
MTTVISRYFDSSASAQAVQEELIFAHRFPRGIMRVYTSPEGLDALTAGARMAAETAAAYKAKMASDGGVVLVVDADYRPLGVAKITRRVTAKMGAVDMGDLLQEVTAPSKPKATLSIIAGHPFMMTRRLSSRNTRFHMANWPIPLITRRGPIKSPSIIKPHGRMADFPLPLISRRKPYSDMIYVNRHQRMADKPIALLVPGRTTFYADKPIAHLLPGHKYQAQFPFDHLIPGHKFQAGWPIKHLVPGHARMARWPFPLLIDEKPGANSLVPGHKYMARFPFDHLIPGHKFQAGVPIAHLIPGHKYMAKFPFAHIVPGHKYMAKFPFAHIVPGHKYMAKFPFAHIVPGHPHYANWPIPLLSRRESA